VDDPPAQHAFPLQAGLGPPSEASPFDTGSPSDNDAPTFTGFYVVENAAGPLAVPESAAADYAGYPVPGLPGGAQQATTDARWLIHTGGDYYDFEDFRSRVVRATPPFPYDYEWRFTGTSLCLDLNAYLDGMDDPIIEVPFELWRIGYGTPDDVSDDVRMTCQILEGPDGEGGNEQGVCDIGGDSPVSDGDDDPYSDWVYVNVPEDDTPGEAGYLADVEDMRNGGHPGAEVLGRLVLVNLDGGNAPPYATALPETGTVFRITTGPRPYLAPARRTGRRRPGDPHQSDLLVEPARPHGALPAPGFRDA
jgi:hypothetical protein